jgi:hypothetical protein
VIAVATVIAVLSGSSTFAQYRPDQAPVTQAPVVQPRPRPNALEEFKADYRAAGEPRVLLFWNVAFDDSTETEHQNIEQTRSSRSQSSTSLEKKTNGAAGAATLREDDQNSKDMMDRVSGSRAVNPAKHSAPIDTVASVELETSFRRQLQVGAVRLVNRDFNIRLTQAAKDRSGVDPKLLEADAVADHSDWLLEILMVPDRGTPLGVGFKVTVTDVRNGTELLSLYSAARPQLETLPSYYAATPSGFELQHPRLQPTVADVGISLAREIMESLRPLLAQRPSNSMHTAE